MNPTRKIYYLSHCDTCLRILHELRSLDQFVFQDIKEDPITEEELETLKQSTGKYELLFNKRAKLYKERNLNKQSLTGRGFQKTYFRALYLPKTPYCSNWRTCYIRKCH